MDKSLTSLFDELDIRYAKKVIISNKKISTISHRYGQRDKPKVVRRIFLDPKQPESEASVLASLMIEAGCNNDYLVLLDIGKGIPSWLTNTLKSLPEKKVWFTLFLQFTQDKELEETTKIVQRRGSMNRKRKLLAPDSL